MVQMEPFREQSNKEWRPSEVNKARLSSLSSAQAGRRKAIVRGVRLGLGILLFPIGVFVFWKLWGDPSAQELHAPLAALGGAIVILLLAAVTGKRLRRPRRDDKSVLHL